MKTDKDNGGPAFPNPGHGNGPGNYRGHPAAGMTLRDYFAAKAMQGMLADLPKTLYGLDWQQRLADRSYEAADAMLEARAL